MSWDDPHAWRNGYDEWKLRSPYDDYAYDDEPPEPMRLFVYQPRMTLQREAESRALANRAALAAKELTRAGDWRRRVAIYNTGLRLGLNGRDPQRQSEGIRHLVTKARKFRTTIGPVVSDSLIEIPF